jgi:protein-S-isoprenylcysteine O-methyltransferase Ste14
MNRARPVLGALVVLYFIIGLEVLVMISPFAGFFYAAFDPVLLFLARWPATHWLADFFLPHMVTPPGAFLRLLRVAGSALFLGGAVTFLVCAGQVYGSKLARRGPVVRGLYRWIRHPQYLALAATGLGLTILWPRFLTAVLWAMMAALYYALARDEERRMTAAFGDAYRGHAERTGMFLPAPVERALGHLPGPRGRATRVAGGLALLFAAAVGGAFALRAYTVRELHLWSDGGRVLALPLVPADEPMVEHRMAAVLALPELRDRLPAEGALLAYVMPVDYVMQGMIADTDPAWRLYQHHQTLPMIADWVLHPFRHLEGGHAGMHGGTQREPHHGAGGMAAGAVRRIILVQVETPAGRADRAAVFATGAARRPLFFADVDLHALRCERVQALGPGTGWGDVPTPTF